MKKAGFLVAALAVQCIAIGWLVLRYERVVTQGVEVRFSAQAYDPFDPLRGRYLQVSVVDSTTNIAAEIVRKAEGEGFYGKCLKSLPVRIEPGTNGIWHVAEAAFTPSGKGVWIKPKRTRLEYNLPYSERKEDENWGEFEKRRKSSGFKIEATLPDRLFVNEDLAPEAEKILQDVTRVKGKGAVAVYRVYDGEIVITGIEVEGKSVMDIAREGIEKGE